MGGHAGAQGAADVAGLPPGIHSGRDPAGAPSTPLMMSDNLAGVRSTSRRLCVQQLLRNV